MWDLGIKFFVIGLGTILGAGVGCLFILCVSSLILGIRPQVIYVTNDDEEGDGQQ